MVKLNCAHNVAQHSGTLRVPILRPLAHDLLRPLQPRQRLGQLGSNGNDLHDRRHQKTQQQGVGEESTNGQSAGRDLMRSHVHCDRAHAAQQHAGRQAHHRGGGESAHDVVQQPADPFGKNRLFPLFRVVALDHAHTAQRLCEPACNLGVDLSAFAKNGTDCRECLVQGNRETEQRADGDERHLRTGAEQQNQRDPGSENSAGEINQTRAQQIAHAFNITHDARNQIPGLVAVVKSHRQARNVRLHLLPQLGYESLCRFRQQLSQRKRRHALNQCGREHEQDQRPQLLNVMFVDDRVDQELGRVRQHQGRHPVDHHQHEAQRQQPAPWTHQPPYFRQNCLQSLRFRGFLRVFLCGTQSSV